MKKLINILTLISVFLIAVSCKNEKEATIKGEPLFSVYKTEKPIVVDGKLDEVWNTSDTTTFNNYYKAEKDSDKQNTTYRMLWDEENLYLFFECEDKYITARETKRDGMPFLDDCAEFFVIPAPKPLNMHYCFEINLNKAVNDVIYLNNIYEEQGMAIKPFNPKIQVEVSVDGTVNDTTDIDKGWTMEVAIPFKTFNRMNEFHPVAEGTQWSFLAIRQERNEVEGERRVTSTNFFVEDFENKDVHQPTMFGLFEFKGVK